MKPYLHIISRLKNNRRNLVLLSFLAWAAGANAQIDIQLNSYWQNPYYITPAYINNWQSMEFTAATRKQWIGFNGAPTTVFGSVSAYWEDIHTKVGLRVFNDKIGYTSVLDASATYAYRLKLSEEWNANLGVALSYQSLDYDLSKITFEGAEETVLYTTLQPKKGANADVGIEFYNDNFRLGTAGKNLGSIFNAKNAIHLNINYLYGMYRQTTDNPVNFGGGVSFTQYGNRFQAGLNAAAYFNLQKQNEVFRIGAFYRTPKEIGAIFSANITDWLSISYCYDYNFGISTHHLGHTHEIMISYRLDPKPVFRWDY